MCPRLQHSHPVAAAAAGVVATQFIVVTLGSRNKALRFIDHQKIAGWAAAAAARD